MITFDYRSYPNQVYFGKGKISILPELLADHQQIMVIATKRMRPYVDQLEKTLGKERISYFSKVIQHVPLHLVQEAQSFRLQSKANALVAIGGGSAIGLAKALALEKPAPILAVPSTFSGSEQTNIWGISSPEGKTTGRSDRVLPEAVIYDPDLSISMPLGLATTSAMNAMAHLMEAIYSPSGNPVTRHHSLLGMEMLKSGLELLGKHQKLTEAANEKILFGAYLAGKSLSEVSMSLHHKAAHVLGGSFGMDHASVHTVLQAYVLDYQWPYLSESIREDFRNILGDHPPKVLRKLAADAGAETNLNRISFDRLNIDEAAAIMAAKPYANVAPLTKEGLVRMLTNAYEGRFDDDDLMML